MIQFVKCACVVVFISVVVHGETVHFTNSQSQLERSSNVDYGAKGLKTYQLEVPGSDPITIVEAEPWKHGDRTGKIMTNGFDYRDRKTKDYLVPGSTHEIESTRKLNEDDFSGPKKTVYSPELINKFLKEYADKIKNADQRTKDKLKKMEITTPRNNVDIITAGAIYERKKITDKIDFKVTDKIPKGSNRRYSSWDELDAKVHKHPYEDAEGWVTLEAVPWTRSKISKWQANTYKVNKPNNNFNSFERDPSQNPDRFSSTYGNPDSEYNIETKPSSFYNFPKPVLSNERPNYDAYHSDNDWPPELPSGKPSWDKPSQNVRPSYQHEIEEPERRPHRPDCDHEHHQTNPFEDTRRVSNQYYESGGIITDGKPGGFPSSGYSSYKKKDMQYARPTEVSYLNEDSEDHPLSYPSKGNGQWVLLSTTKGYKFPKNRQRSLSITPNAITSHRAVRLTVLPAVNGSKENMTLSHGGMLEVEPSFHTVDESRRIYERSQRFNSTTPRPKKTRRIIATDATPDSSAVMAAVGAGLVPATVAMIMPMVLGRKKRSLVNPDLVNFPYFQNVTQHPQFDFESTLQRSL